MAFRGIKLLLILCLLEINLLTALTATENETVEIAIIYNSSDRYMNSILERAEDLFVVSRRELKRTQKETSNVKINVQWLDEAEISSSYSSFSYSLFDKWNISLQVQGAVFVDISSKSLFLSSLLESSAIPSVGIFQTREQPRTQESSAYFSRVALPSMKHYAQVIWEVMKKTGLKSLSLVLTADSDSKELEDSMSEIIKLEKWTIKRTIWLVHNRNITLQVEMKSLVAKQADVVVVHSRDTENDLLFQVIQSFNVSKAESLWILTDITEHGIQDINNIPVGSLRISSKRRESYRDHSRYSMAINDALLIYQAAFEKAYARSRCLESDCLLEERCGRLDIQDLAKMYLKEAFIEGKSLLFAKPSLFEISQTTFEVWNLRQSQSNASDWVLVGLRTPTGFALDNLMAPNGSTVIVPSVLAPHVMRVPVNLYSPWVQVDEPRFDGNGMLYCIGRGQLCYKFKNSSRVIETTFCCFGASIDLLGMIQDELGFRSEIYFTPDENYGDFDEKTKMWNGIVQEVISGEADFAIDISMTELREQYLDFAHPFIHLALNVLVLKDDRISDEIQWSSWLEPFQYQLWFSIVGFINFTLVVIWWVDRKSPYGHFRQLDSGDDGFTLLDSMTYVWGVAFGKDIGAEKTPHSGSARCVSTFYAFFALIVANTYCANLMAFLVQETFELPISGIRDSKIRHPSLKPPKGFKLGIQQDSQEESYFKLHSEDIFREIYHLNLKVNFVKNFADGIQKLKNRLGREIHGLVGDYLSLSQVANKDLNCSFSLAGPNFFNFGLGMAMRNASPWLQDVNQAVLKHQENGTIETIEERWFNKKSCDLNSFTELDITNLSGLFMAIVIVLSFCVFAVLVEFLLVFIFMKLGNRLGACGKSVKRFVFNLKRGEEDLLNMRNWFVFRQRTETWDVSTCTETSETFQELSFLNDAYFTPRETGFHSETFYTPHEQLFHDSAYFASNKQSMKGKKLKQGETADTIHEIHEIPNGKATFANASNSSRTKSLKQSGIVVTKL